MRPMCAGSGFIALCFVAALGSFAFDLWSIKRFPGACKGKKVGCAVRTGIA